MNNIITILDNITETSMPFNEFVNYRASHFNNEKHTVIVLDKKRDLPKAEIEESIDIFYVGRKPLSVRKKIKEIIKKNKNGNLLIHMHQPRSAFLFNVYSIGLKLKKKKMYTIHSTFSGYHIHNKILTVFNILSSNITTCVSSTSYNAIPRFLKRIKRGNIISIQNGVDTERIDKVLEKIKKKEKKVINFVYVARIIPIKNHAFLIEVINELKNCSNIKFTFIGSTKEADNIINKCKEYKLDKLVEFTGLISRNEVFEKLMNSDIYISSSTLEGMPVSVLEAMYCKLPVILSDIPQHRELVKSEKYIPILNFNIEEWKKTLTTYIKMSKKEREKIGNNCKDYVIQKFSLINMHKKYSKEYDKIYNI